MYLSTDTLVSVLEYRRQSFNENLEIENSSTKLPEQQDTIIPLQVDSMSKRTEQLCGSLARCPVQSWAACSKVPSLLPPVRVGGQVM